MMTSESIPLSAALSPDVIGDLPDHGLLALVTRQVARNFYVIPGSCRHEIFNDVCQLQEVSRLGYGDPLLPLSEVICKHGDTLLHSKEPNPAVEFVARSLYELGRVTRCVWADDYDKADQHCIAALTHADTAARYSGVLITPDILMDIEAAHSHAAVMAQVRPKGSFNYGRRRRQSFSQDVFADYQSFDLNPISQGSSVVEVISLITEELIARLAEHPTRLYELSSRAFEELIARVFEIYGFNVELTAPTRDSGRDVIAVSYNPVPVKYLIECKKYARHNKVGIAFVQRLHGVLHGDQGTRAILATTSAFTQPAREYMRRPHVQLELEGRDFSGIHGWLLLADRTAAARRALGDQFRLSETGILLP